MDHNFMKSQKAFMITTERLLLRPHDQSDLSFMVELNSDPEVNKYTGDSAITIEEAKEILQAMCVQFEKYKTSRLIVILKESYQRIGWCGLKYVNNKTADLGYRFLKAQWGNGYAYEAATACLQLANQMKFELILAEVDTKNSASINLLKKLGFNKHQTISQTEIWHKKLVHKKQ